VAAASQGLGYGIARALAAEGARVGLCSRRRDAAHAAAETIRTETGAEVDAEEVDVSEAGGVRRWLDQLGGRWGGLDLVVPNAGGPQVGTFAETAEEAWDRSYALTLRSALAFARYSKPHLRPGGSMLFLTSRSVREPAATLALSTIFRPGVAALAKLLADEWANEGIRVNHLIPGRIATDRVAAHDEQRAERSGVDFGEAQAASSRAIPMGRYGSVDEFSAAAVFLLSDAASYITGATLQVDGGALRSIV
jgi:3-oxoacyl-[acyl-carrier protein] reductase